MANVEPLHIMQTMPSGLEYDVREIRACVRWWRRLEVSQRWWMLTSVYPQNPIQSRFRAGIGPYGQTTASGEPVVPFAIIANGSTEIEARIHVMRQAAQIIDP